MQTPTIALCTCPEGCVILKFGYVNVQLPRAVFLAFAKRIQAMAEALVSGEVTPTVEH
jgi:hypothetical protein